MGVSINTCEVWEIVAKYYDHSRMTGIWSLMQKFPILKDYMPRMIKALLPESDLWDMFYIPT